MENFEKLIELYKLQDVNRFGEVVNNTERNKEMLRARFIDDLSFAKIAKANDVSERLVRGIINKAIFKIKQEIA